jgi:hypothetical protein
MVYPSDHQISCRPTINDVACATKVSPYIESSFKPEVYPLRASPHGAKDNFNGESVVSYSNRSEKRKILIFCVPMIVEKHWVRTI